MPGANPAALEAKPPLDHHEDRNPFTQPHRGRDRLVDLSEWARRAEQRGFECVAGSENVRGWVQAHDQILEYDFDAIVCGHANRWGTENDARTSREYINDMVKSAIEALEQISDAELVQRAGFHNPWFVLDTWLNELVNYVTHKILTMQTSTGQRWTPRLAGVDVVTKYHAYDIVELLRMEWGVQGSMDKRLNGEIPIPG